MIKCKCGGMVTDCLGELPDDNNPCVCDKLKIKKLEAKISDLNEVVLSYHQSKFSSYDAFWEMVKILTHTEKGKGE